MPWHRASNPPTVSESHNSMVLRSVLSVQEVGSMWLGSQCLAKPNHNNGALLGELIGVPQFARCEQASANHENVMVLLRSVAGKNHRASNPRFGWHRAATSLMRSLKRLQFRPTPPNVARIDKETALRWHYHFAPSGPDCADRRIALGKPVGIILERHRFGNDAMPAPCKTSHVYIVIYV